MTRVPWCIVVIEYKFGPGRPQVLVFGSDEEAKTWAETHTRQPGEKRTWYFGGPDFEYAPNAVYAAESLL